MIFIWYPRTLCVVLSLFILTACLPAGWIPSDSSVDAVPSSESESATLAAATTKPVAVTPKAPATLAGAKPLPAKTAAKRFYAYTHSVKCEALLAAVGKKESEEKILLIIAGFMTGVNYVKGSDRPLDLRSMLMVTENYCRNNGGKSLTEALIFLDASLESSRAGGPDTSSVTQSAAVPPASATKAPATATATKAPAIATATKAPAIATATKAPANQETRFPSVDPGGTYVVQVYSTNSNAEVARVLDLLKSEGFVARVEKVNLGNRGIWYRIVLGPYADADHAEIAAEKLRQKKFQTIVRQR